MSQPGLRVAAPGYPGSVEPAPFSVMLKPVGPRCDQRCAYCYYRRVESMYPSGPARMPPRVLDAFTRRYLRVHPGPEVVFAWQGGEPLLAGTDFFRGAFRLQRRACPPGKTVSNTVQTNGLLVDDAWCRLLAGHDVLVGLSLDGPAEVHDAFRRDGEGRPTQRRVVDALRRLQDAGVEVNAMTCVHAASAGHGREVYRYLRDVAGVRHLQLIPVVEWTDDGRTSRRSVDGEAFGRFLVDVFEEWRVGDVGRVFVRHLDAAAGALLGDPFSSCVHAPTCGTTLALEATGDLYACDHFVRPGHRLGNVVRTPLERMVDSGRQRAFGLAKRDTLPEACLRCPVLDLCAGGCPKDRRPEPDGSPGPNVLCAGYRTFFEHVRPFLSTLVRGAAQAVPPREEAV